MNKKITSFGLVALAGLSLCAGVALSKGGISNLHADEVNTWKHFAAVMPTETTKGIREYWTNCVSETRLSAPEGVSAEDATLNAEQIETILADADDTRIIPTLAEISRSVAKGYDGKSANQGYDVKTAYAYTYLDDATKADVSGADETKIKSAYEAYEGRFAEMDLPLVGGAQYSFNNFTLNETYVDGYGEVYEMSSGTTATGWASFKYVDASFDLTGYDSVSFYIYNPTGSAWNDVRIMNDEWSKGSQLTISVAAHSWGEFKIDKVWFDTYTDSKFSSWWIGIVNYTGYESATETLKISKPVARKIAAAALDFDEAVSSISSTSNPTRADAYYIYKAGQYLSSMSEDAKEASKKLDDYNTAKGNCTYTIGGLFDPATFPYTGSWGVAGTASNVSDSEYGQILKIAVNNAVGAAESTMPSVSIDTAAYDTVSFYVKADWEVQFCLSKKNWWTNAYDFSAGTWIDNGQNTAFRTGVDTWALCTMSVADFNLCKYYSFLNNGAVGQNFYISPIYLSSSGSN